MASLMSDVPSRAFASPDHYRLQGAVHLSRIRSCLTCSSSGASKLLRSSIQVFKKSSRCGLSRGGRIACSSSAVPARTEGRSTYKPPSFAVLIQDAANSIIAAISDGLTRLEVEFPVLPEDQDGYRGSSDDYIDTNIQLAIAAAKQMYAIGGKRVHILVPDGVEYDRAYKLFKTTLDLTEGITLGHLKEANKGIFSGFSGLFGNSTSQEIDLVDQAKQADVYVAVNASTVELPDIERYTEETAASKPMILWNLGVDTLRADLGGSLMSDPTSGVQRVDIILQPFFQEDSSLQGMRISPVHPKQD